MDRSPRRPTHAHPRPARLLLLAGLVAAVISVGAGASALAADPWTAEEQQFAYDLNRARWSPAGVEAAAGLPAGTIAPRPPLAVNDSLAAAAGFRVDEMAQHDYFAHRSPITGDWPNKVARDFGYPLPLWFPDDENNIESIFGGNPSGEVALGAFIGSPSHRDHVMGQGGFAAYSEIGVGANLGKSLWGALIATDAQPGLFLTGVVFADADGDRRLDLGEGLAGVTITAGGQTTTSNAGGGWALRLPAGRYRITADGGPLPVTSTAVVRLGKYNVGVDFLSGLARPQVRAYETCAGKAPTILGTAANDRIQGTPGDDVIAGGAGRDIINGGGGNDLICGGGGNDTLRGGTGRDILIGGGGTDTCLGGEDNRTCEF